MPGERLERNRIAGGSVWRVMERRLAYLLALGLLAAACGSPAPSATPTGSATAAPTGSPTTVPADFEIDTAQFTETGGCGDTFLWATNRAGTAGITVEWTGTASAAWANAGFTDTQQLPNPEITVAVVEGNGLTGYWCNDVRMPGQGVNSTVEAVSGSVELAVRPTPGGFKPAGQADLRLSDVTFELGLGSGEVWHLAELVIQNVSVGWMAG